MGFTQEKWGFHGIIMGFHGISNGIIMENQKKLVSMKIVADHG